MSFDGFPSSPPPAVPVGATVFFERAELNAILRIYGRMVAAGEWKDYAIGGNEESAVFAVFRRASEAPLYRIEKRPALARRQGAWSVTGPGGLVIRRGHELAQVLKVFDSRRFQVID